MAGEQVWSAGNVAQPGRARRNVRGRPAPTSGMQRSDASVDGMPAAVREGVPRLPGAAFIARLRRCCRLSLVQQLMLLVMGFSCLAIAVVLAILASRHLDEVAAMAHENARNIAGHTARAAAAPLLANDRRSLLEMARAAQALPGTELVQIRSSYGEIVASARAGQNVAATPGVEILEAIRNPAAGLRIGEVMVRLDGSAQLQARRNLLWTCALLFVGSMLVVGFTGWWVARRVSAPLRELARVVDQLASADDVAVQAAGIGEIGRLQRGFNRAASALADQRRLLQEQVRAATLELEQKNAQLEAANKAKSQLLAAASHDLRQPLHALTLFAETLQAGELDPARRENATRVKQCVDSLDRMFSGLIDLAKLDANAMEPQNAVFALDGLFDEISRNFRAQAEAQELRLVVRQTAHWLCTDYLMLARVLNNLVSNALRYTVQGGILVAARRRGDRLRIDVVDTGIGIAAQHQSRVFEEFYQVDASAFRPERGLGLGLATVRRLVPLLGATVQLHSRPGRGTRFSISLPLYRGDTEASARTPPSLRHLAGAMDQAKHRGADAPRTSLLPSPGGEVTASLTAQPCHAEALQGLRVWLIDDEAVILEGLALLLEQAGAQVVTALSGRQALQLAQEMDDAPDVVVSDLLLGGGDSGLDALAALGRLPHWQACPPGRLLVTGETAEYRLREMAASGIEVLYKPVAPPLLRERIAAAAARRKAAINAYQTT